MTNDLFVYEMMKVLVKISLKIIGLVGIIASFIVLPIYILYIKYGGILAYFNITNTIITFILGVILFEGE